ncbi:rhamnosyltransferase [Clostridium collagenovorans DSM 3089]|uniref:Rhamnosyltransferase n=1 Tax=Clostridium collagenovorans DSM 3089 TaxID=1121306 RepID=A0A1M5YJG4_9CLOT|nr:glycosyltransferase family 2 protein [Clostridium collagenovorans]SHI12092.1 rhamnosyltransferase [Clostridium collagenovorans DSM 3089]
MNTIYAVIVTYNPDDELISSIKALKDQVNDIIIVDNGSDNISFLNSLKESYKIKILFNSSNLGIAKALNQGVKYSLSQGADWILTLDQDSICTNNMIETMLNSYYALSIKDQERIALIAPKYIEKKYIDSYNIIKSESIYEFLVITSGNLIKKSTFSNIGFFKEDLFIDFVDHEFCLRINTKGYKILLVCNAILLHSLGDSKKLTFLSKALTITNHSYIRRYYITRNRFYLWKEYKTLFPNWVKEDKHRFINELIKILIFEDNKFNKLKMIKKGIKDYSNNVVGKINL